MVTPLCGVSSDVKPFPVKSRYFVPLMVTALELRLTELRFGVVTTVGLAGLTTVRSAALLFSLAVALFALPLKLEFH
jgi:hypothetical protein